jgi:prolyl-tRNA editing enzyme YbaK/EbsC (Cys-tRNA(Pro) deacylase)
MTELKAAAKRVQERAESLGLDVDVRQMPASTRTAQEAAAACGCAVAQIVKSLVFKGEKSHRPYLLLVSGSNRVNEKSVAAIVGEALMRPDARFVREVTGYAIGGIPPFGHSTPLATYMDQDLLQYELVWAAAGTPEAIFSVAPQHLRRR